MSEETKNWAQLRELLLQFDRAEFQLVQAARHLEPTGKDRRAALHAALKRAWDARQAKRASIPFPATTSAKPVSPEDLKIILSSPRESLDPGAEWLSLEPLAEPERQAVAAYRRVCWAFWRAKAWLARGLVMVPKYIGLRRGNRPLADALNKIRGLSKTYVDYGLPDFEDDDDLIFADEFLYLAPPDWVRPPMVDFGYWHPEEYNEAERWLMSGGVLVTTPLPDNVISALGRCKRAFVRGCPDATVALCRSLVDAATHYWLVRAGARPYLSESEWKRDRPILERKRPDLSGPLRAVDEMRTKANRVVHPDAQVEFDDNSALEALQATFDFIERLLGPD